MRNFIKYFLILLLLGSCVKLALNRAGIVDKEVKINQLYNGTKNVLFIEMHHIGKKEFYKNVKTLTDSLQINNFSIFYESIIVPEYLSQEESKSLAKKHRKITGNSGNLYLDTINNILLGKYKIPKKYKLINQPSNEYLFDIDYAQNMDAQLDSIILKFEKMFGNIELTECDLQTELYEASFDCETLSRKDRKMYIDSIVIGYRNSIITDAVFNSKNNKIALFYGKAHFTGIKKLLEEQGYKEVE
ncbi:MAG: hypothetical protein H0X63_00735 [Flavobacteriales bacterium]|jgi:hypothetical protein|nr:hypothetical protein [Flavobacteriales bacterium]